MDVAERIAAELLEGFDRHYELFRSTTAQAKQALARVPAADRVRRDGRVLPVRRRRALAGAISLSCGPADEALDLRHDGDAHEHPGDGADLSCTADVQRAQRAPHEEVRPARERCAVDEADTALVARGDEAEERRPLLRAVSQQPEPEALLEVDGTFDDRVVQLRVAKLVEQHAERCCKAE